MTIEIYTKGQIIPDALYIFVFSLRFTFKKIGLNFFIDATAKLIYQISALQPLRHEPDWTGSNPYSPRGDGLNIDTKQKGKPNGYLLC